MRLTEEQMDFLDGLETPEWTARTLAEKLAAGDEKVIVKAGRDPRRRQLTLNGKDIELAIRYLTPKYSDWLDSRHLLKR